MKSRTKKVLIVGCIVVGALGIVAYRARNARPDGPSFKPVTVSRGDLRITVLTTGSVAPENRLIIKPPIAGRIDQVLIREGMRVKRGQVLAWMSSTDRAALMDVASAKGPEEVKRWQELYKAAPLVAPLDGIIISRNIEQGQTVSTGDTTFIMSDHLMISAQVDETDMAKIHLKQPAEITLDAYPAEKVMGKVHRIAFEARTVNNVTIYDILIQPDKVPDFMRSGMTANATFLIAEKKSVLLLPTAAIRQDPEKSQVMRPGPGEDARVKPSLTDIKTGLTDGKFVEITGGLSEGDVVLQQIIATGKDGDRKGGNPFSPFGSSRGVPKK